MSNKVTHMPDIDLLPEKYKAFLADTLQSYLDAGDARDAAQAQRSAAQDLVVSFMRAQGISNEAMIASYKGTTTNRNGYEVESNTGFDVRQWCEDHADLIGEDE